MKSTAPPPLKSIEDEKSDCIEAFEKHRTSAAWCCHHDVLCEPLSALGPVQRIEFITYFKPTMELAARFRNFRPVKSMKEYTMNNWNSDKLQEQFDKEWPDNTWNGNDIF